MSGLIPFAQSLGRNATKALSKKNQKGLGQFMTPTGIAKAMAQRVCTNIDTPIVRLLEPAAGAGILAAAVLEELLANDSRPNEIEVTLCEIDPRFKPALDRLSRKMRHTGRSAGVKIKVSVKICDFLLSQIAEEKPKFDIVIANPPYFKLTKSDPRAKKHAYAVHGQPNIYGLFMAACSRILAPQGKWCFITPRSWTNGPYFTAVRRQVLRNLRISAMHVFESRREHFTDDEILQEAMITWATVPDSNSDTIVVSMSQGIRDLPQATLRTLATNEVISDEKESTISLPIHDGLRPLRQFKGNILSYGIKVSTGPVVAFRAAAHITESKKRNSAPLLWLQHIHHMRVCWPIQKKREHISVNGATAWMLIPNQNMVLMRRFSPKEDQRRITAAPYIAGTLPGNFIGLENHTNYLYHPSRPLAVEEIRGLSAYLNSRIVDLYLRVVCGNTQINAADLRTLPLPPLSTLTQIGSVLPNPCSLEEADRAVEEALGIEFISIAA